MGQPLPKNNRQFPLDNTCFPANQMHYYFQKVPEKYFTVFENYFDGLF